MEAVNHSALFQLGLLLATGYAGGLAAGLVKLPRVTGYILAGLALSPSTFGILGKLQVEAYLSLVSEIALAVIAFAIGGSLPLHRIKRVGKPILWITTTQGLGAFVMAALTVYLASFLFPVLIAQGFDSIMAAVFIMGAISVATAPAAVLAVLHELRAKGPITTTLLGIVALDDALTIVLFSLVSTLVGQLWPVGTMVHGGIMAGLMEIVGAVIAGGLAGLILPKLLGRRQRGEFNLVLIMAAVFLVGGVSLKLGFSPLLANMMMGFVVINRMPHAEDLFHQLEDVEELVFCLFFALAGAHFDLSVLPAAIGLGSLLLIGRFAGKISGAMAGAEISHAPKGTGKYLGIALLPQAGLSLGLIFLARPMLPEIIYEVMLNAMLASVILNELIAPVLLKMALDQAGETHVG